MSEAESGGVVRVLVVDDHPVVRSGLVGMLAPEPGIEVVGEAGDGDEAVARVAASAPDVVLMDLRMPGLDGVAATERIVAGHPSARVLVLTTYAEDADILRAVEAGATGYLLKDVRRADLVTAIRAAARGETVLAPPVAARLASHLVSSLRPVAEGAAVSLTPREREVLALVAEGLSNARIADRLHIGEATVKTHLLRVFAKLEVDDRTLAVTRAMSLNLLPPPHPRPPP